MKLTAYHAKYIAHLLTLRSTNGVERLARSLFDAAVDLNPHQIDAAVFALDNPLAEGVVLADEVGLGKTIEAGLSFAPSLAPTKVTMAEQLAGQAGPPRVDRIVIQGAETEELFSIVWKILYRAKK